MVDNRRRDDAGATRPGSPTSMSRRESEMAARVQVDSDGWRRTQTIRALQETLSTYRAVANELASRVNALKQELAQLRAERAGRAPAEITVGEVWLALD